MRALLPLVLVVAAGCFGAPTPGQRLTDSAYEMNTASRFGRMDIAMDHVAAPAKADFARRHSIWGHDVRIVDIEFAGMNLLKKDLADIYLAVSWQRADESTVRVTEVTQHWKDDSGWVVVSEERKSGDYGVFGEPSPKAPPAAPAAEPPRQAQFKTRVIYEEE
jgi:hypothetical protein